MMNKSLILSLLLVPFLTNCNKGPSYTVTPQEMYDALIMKGVTYLQMADSANVYVAFTPISYHMIDEDGDYPHHHEKIMIKDGTREEAYEKWNIGEDFETIDFIEEDFRKISDIVNGILAALVGKEYNDFIYDGNKKEYMIDTSDEYGTYHNAIRFLNKKVSYFDSWGSEYTRETAIRYTFTYEKIEPPSPQSVIE